MMTCVSPRKLRKYRPAAVSSIQSLMYCHSGEYFWTRASRGTAGLERIISVGSKYSEGQYKNREVGCDSSDSPIPLSGRGINSLPPCMPIAWRNCSRAVCVSSFSPEHPSRRTGTKGCPQVSYDEWLGFDWGCVFRFLVSPAEECVNVYLLLRMRDDCSVVWNSWAHVYNSI
jgi:hypothetical protein